MTCARLTGRALPCLALLPRRRTKDVAKKLREIAALRPLATSACSELAASAAALQQLLHASAGPLKVREKALACPFPIRT